mmetsp:Transcript_65148/g.165130  ORF Transcript_65148/g.165130 Transcript_65148/m.165130 type:complete len:219 (+) Transcript_65148:598-1254(+)
MVSSEGPDSETPPAHEDSADVLCSSLCTLSGALTLVVAAAASAGSSTGNSLARSHHSIANVCESPCSLSDDVPSVSCFKSTFGGCALRAEVLSMSPSGGSSVKASPIEARNSGDCRMMCNVLQASPRLPETMGSRSGADLVLSSSIAWPSACAWLPRPVTALSIQECARAVIRSLGAGFSTRPCRARASTYALSTASLMWSRFAFKRCTLSVRASKKG